MSNNFVNRSPFLEQKKKFSGEIQELSKEIFDTYQDIARYTNDRTIGTYSIDKPTVTGEKWFISSVANSGFRKIIRIDGPGSFPHYLNTETFVGFTNIYGTATDGTNWFPLPYVSETDVTDQISVLVTPGVNGNVVITAGAGAPPTITDGFIVLEWIAQNKL